MPTILGLYDVPEPYVLAGRSLRPLLQNAASPQIGDDSTLAEAIRALQERTLYASNYTYKSFNVVEGVVIDEGHWKLMYCYDKVTAGPDTRPVQFKLYDVVRDPDERNNLINAHKDTARRLIERLTAYRISERPFDPGARAHELELDPDQLRELQSLGYIGEIETTRDDE